MNIGFIGLGIMGTPMAGHLAAAGHQLFVHTRREVPAALAATAAVACANAREVARQSEVIFIMVPDTPDVEAVLFGEQGVAAGLAAGTADTVNTAGGTPRRVIVDMSSISPLATKAFALKINTLGADYIDAPVSGGEVGAKAASLTIMCGGDEAVFERVRPLLALMGKNITLVGGNGDGQTTKVANQIIVALNIAAVGEALLFASKAGADPAKVRQALMGGFAASRVLEVHGERMIKRTFAPGFRIKLHQKDLNLALQGAREIGVSLPQTASAAQLMQAVAANGGAELDHSALVQALELMAAHAVAKP
jgi:2-hydroxy-3-oxopropionate reductase